MTEENKTGQYLWSVTEVKTEKKKPLFFCQLLSGHGMILLGLLVTD